MHQSFVSTPPPTGIVVGYGAVQVLFDCPAVPGNCGGFNSGTLTIVRFSVVKGGAKSRVVAISLSPQDSEKGKVTIPAHPRR